MFIPFIFALVILVLVIYAIFDSRRKRYEKFVEENSVCIERIKEINTKYQFCNVSDLNEKKDYDNKKFYDNISCEDYLIYELQFKQKFVYEQIRNAKNNRTEYQKYEAEINSVTVRGEYKLPTGKYKIALLNSYEQKAYEKILKSPKTQFFARIILRRTDMNGRVFEEKYGEFDKEKVVFLIKRVNDKFGDFFRDREIWDAICRVERGKVSNKMRFAVYRRDGYRCRKCGRTDRHEDLEIDHIYPIAKGGKTTYDNLQTLCHKCNQKKSDKLDWM